MSPAKTPVRHELQDEEAASPPPSRRSKHEHSSNKQQEPHGVVDFLVDVATEKSFYIAGPPELDSFLCGTDAAKVIAFVESLLEPGALDFLDFPHDPGRLPKAATVPNGTWGFYCLRYSNPDGSVTVVLLYTGESGNFKARLLSHANLLSNSGQAKHYVKARGMKLDAVVLATVEPRGLRTRLGDICSPASLPIVKSATMDNITLLVRRLLEAVAILFYDAVALPPTVRGILLHYNVPAIFRYHLNSESPISRSSTPSRRAIRHPLTSCFMAGYQVLLVRYAPGFGTFDLTLGYNNQIAIGVGSDVMIKIEETMTEGEMADARASCATPSTTSKRVWPAAAIVKLVRSPTDTLINVRARHLAYLECHSFELGIPGHQAFPISMPASREAAQWEGLLDLLIEEEIDTASASTASPPPSGSTKLKRRFELTLEGTCRYPLKYQDEHF